MVHRKLLFLVAVAMLAGCRPSNGGNPQGKGPEAAVTTGLPKKTPMRRVIEQPATVEAFEETPLVARIPGYVDKVEKDIGDEVKRGNILAELSVPELIKEQAQKAALVKQAKAEVELAKAQKGEAEAGIVRADANRRRWELECERVAGLLKDKVVQQQIYDETVSQFESAKAAKLEAVAKLGRAKADIDVAGARVEVAQAEADRVKALAEYRFIVAPFDGVVTRRNVHTGHFLQPNASGSPGVLFVVARTDKLRISADIPETEAGYLSGHPTAKVHSPIFRDASFEAKVTRTSWTLDTKSRTLRIEIHHTDKSAKLRPGMFVNVTFTIDLGERNALPMSAIIPQSDPPACWRVVAGKAVRTPLKLGVRDGQNVEVLQMQKGTTWEAVTGSEEVVLTGLGAVSDGKEVNVQKK